MKEKMTECYIGIGSNIGHREKNISKAIEFIGQKERILSVSSLIETEPEYYLHQRRFLNCAILISTLKNPKELLSFLQQIEHTMKRKRVITYGPRIIDLDILFYHHKIMN